MRTRIYAHVYRTYTRIMHAWGVRDKKNVKNKVKNSLRGIGGGGINPSSAPPPRLSRAYLIGLVLGLYRVRFGTVEGLLRASSTFVSLCRGSGRQPRILPIRQDRREVYVRARVRVCLYVQARGVWVLGRPGRFGGRWRDRIWGVGREWPFFSKFVAISS